MINFKKFNSVISLTSYFTSDDQCKHICFSQFLYISLHKIEYFF